MLTFDSANPDGYISGARYVYTNGETDAVAKNIEEVKAGDVIEPICDYYTYNKEYKDSYLLGDTLVVDKDMKDMLISNTYMGDGDALMSYCFTDIYGQKYWTPMLTY